MNFMSVAKSIIRSVLSQGVINKFHHLPNAVLANLKYSYPTRKLKVIGITGTDGKTTTTNMVYKILKDAGKKVSMVSTINAVIGGKIYDTGFHVTSPSPQMVQKFAKIAVEHGDEYLVLEATSHALDQYRFLGIKFDIAVLTNITHEHLDYHKSFENYTKAKLKLINNSKIAIVNENIKGISKKTITFGLHSGDFNQDKYNLKLKMPGDYNTENALAAFTVAKVLGIDEKVIRQSLQSFDKLKGRMEEVENKKGIKIIIDFAHTPNALENALQTLRKETKGHLIAIFGSAGKRDADKRPLMGEIGMNLADLVIITAEDPRGQLEIINEQITKGALKSGAILDKNYFIIPDRQSAINFAIQTLAKKGDIVGIFGKGHETSMNIDGKSEIPWSDTKAVRKALS